MVIASLYLHFIYPFSNCCLYVMAVTVSLWYCVLTCGSVLINSIISSMIVPGTPQIYDA